MKKLLLFLLVSSLLFVGCSKVPDDTTTTFEKSTQGVIKVDSVGLNPFGNTKALVTTYFPEYAVIQPTWGQSFHYAWKSGYALWFITSLVLLAFVVYSLYKLAKDEDLIKGIEPKGWMIIVAVFAAFFSFGTQPGVIKWNNYKKLDRSYYESTIKTEGSSRVIWDSLYNSNRIIGANSK